MVTIGSGRFQLRSWSEPTASIPRSRAWSALKPDPTGRHATGVVFTYWSGPGFDGYHWYYNPGVSACAIDQ